MSQISQSYISTLKRISDAVSNSTHSPTSVALLAVSKLQPTDKIRQLYLLGQHAFGESYLQEALLKMAELNELSIEWHFIGPIQSNKSRKIAENFDWVQSVDSIKLIRRLSSQRPLEKKPLDILLQVNIDEEQQKRGIAAADVTEFAELAISLPGICLRGLMAIPDPGKSLQQQNASLQKMVSLFNQIKPLSMKIDTLSLGMSLDLEAAIAAGSTMVRIGTSLFGPRKRPA